MSADLPKRLRAPATTPPFHIVLLNPEIPQNTGSIARMCAATGCPLHLVGTLGFRIDEKAVRRAGLDYWHLVYVRRHLDMAHFSQEIPQDRWRLLSARASRSYLEAKFQPGMAIIFGCESKGLPDELLDQLPDQTIGIPMIGAVRSLNLSTSAGIVTFEALRSCGFLDGAALAPIHPPESSST
jgi:tRNA (cytidine/uridine-2'-O-)-methyltransferase